ncbi:hypothetical protein MF672_030950 [Actinomadura sp. ATCC 31491]|uniref:DUF397 domain-containing protein n=1 Tax=Actinomadura luzonensis TaxID=2805427 RepID=A0ABT0G247_9ACTN|nr:hypothetical protein [Actinomadura luzonensis]MCK2218176.1 hypothetical protein [Actinomadura luzonensis]
MKRDDAAQKSGHVTLLYPTASDFCTVFTTHDDIGAAATLIGAVVASKMRCKSERA